MRAADIDNSVRVSTAVVGKLVSVRTSVLAIEQRVSAQSHADSAAGPVVLATAPSFVFDDLQRGGDSSDADSAAGPGSVAAAAPSIASDDLQRGNGSTVADDGLDGEDSDACDASVGGESDLSEIDFDAISGSLDRIEDLLDGPFQAEPPSW